MNEHGNVPLQSQDLGEDFSQPGLHMRVLGELELQDKTLSRNQTEKTAVHVQRNLEKNWEYFPNGNKTKIYTSLGPFYHFDE